ncbi:MAG: helix-turn-helix transcriptional regulator [Clostridia bacterium]|nr:helix-turn-helix transcriptional regulator [Clostridia bacterium]
MIDLQTVGASIAFLRRSQGLTQKDLARKMRVCPQAVSKWERGLAFPDVCYLDELAGYLSCTIDELLTGVKHNAQI